MILLLFSGAWEKVIHETNLKQKLSWHCPFKKHWLISVKKRLELVMNNNNTFFLFQKEVACFSTNFD